MVGDNMYYNCLMHIHDIANNYILGEFPQALCLILNGRDYNGRD